MKQHYYLLILLVGYAGSICSMDAEKRPSRKTRKQMWKTVRQTMASQTSSRDELKATLRTILQLIAAVASTDNSEGKKCSRAQQELQERLASPAPLVHAIPHRALPTDQLPLTVVTEDRDHT